MQIFDALTCWALHHLQMPFAPDIDSSSWLGLDWVI